MPAKIFQEIEAELEKWTQRGERRQLTVVKERQGPRIRIGKHWYLNLSSNDYLGLAQGLKCEDLALWLEKLGFGSGASRLLSGNHELYSCLEQELLKLYKRPALIFSSGFLANLGVISTLVGRGDVIFADKLIHASLIDGMRLSGATFFRYPHNDLEALGELLARKRKRFRRALIVTESLFSMDGDIPDLKQLIELKEEYEALLLLDEAHAVGVFGRKGLGLAEELGLLEHIDILVGTFGKALGSYGAFVVTTETLRNYLLNRARSFIFTTALPTVVVAANWWGLTKAAEAVESRKHLRTLACKMRQALAKAGFSLPGSGLTRESQIIPVIVGENEKALALAKKLREEGFFAPAIRPPTVPPGTARLRLSLTSQMSWEELLPLLKILENLRST